MSDKPFKDDRIFIEPPNHVSLISREHLESLQSELSDLRSKLAKSEAELLAARSVVEAARKLRKNSYKINGLLLSLCEADKIKLKEKINEVWDANCSFIKEYDALMKG